MTIDRVQQCIDEILRWCASGRLQRNPTKTEVIWFGMTASLKKIKSIDLMLRAGSGVIKPVSMVRDLGVLQDEELSI